MNLNLAQNWILLEEQRNVREQRGLPPRRWWSGTACTKQFNVLLCKVKSERAHLRRPYYNIFPWLWSIFTLGEVQARAGLLGMGRHVGRGESWGLSSRSGAWGNVCKLKGVGSSRPDIRMEIVFHFYLGLKKPGWCWWQGGAGSEPSGNEWIQTEDLTNVCQDLNLMSFYIYLYKRSTHKSKRFTNDSCYTHKCALF